MRTRILVVISLGVALALTARAQVPGIVNYQGRIVDGGTNFTGVGQFKFALVNPGGTTNYWSNDGTGIGQPASTVSLPVIKGLYSVLLGDTTVPNMTIPVSSSVFANSSVLLRVWFSDGVAGFQQLTPDQRLGAVGYALVAGSVPNGAITSAQIAPGAVGSNQLAAGGVGSAAIAAGGVTAANIGGGQVVKSLNGLTDAVTLMPGANVTLTPVGNSIQIGASGAGGGASNTWLLTGNTGTSPANGNFLGTTDNNPLELWINNSRGLRLQPANPNSAITAPSVIGGSPNNYVDSGSPGGAIGGGDQNSILYTSYFSAIGGGTSNTVSIFAPYSTIGGGDVNLIDTLAAESVIGGGGSNSIQYFAFDSVIGGGNFNSVQTNATDSTIGGGTFNITSNQFATIAGGMFNVSGGNAATVGGGANNLAGASYATVGGGWSNYATAFGVFVGGGFNNIVRGYEAFVGGGAGNTNTGPLAAIGGGLGNAANGPYATVGGGAYNYAVANGSWETVSGGGYNFANSDYATVGGGASNFADAAYATVPGGSSNQVYGTFGFAAGQQAVAVNRGDFVWADSQNAVFRSTGNDQFLVRAQGGVAINTTDPSGYALNVAGTIRCVSLTQSSDRNLKENFTPIDTRAVLDKVAELPITKWNFKTADDARHIGPMAQDFKEAFGLGRDNTTIATVDSEGVALAAIQGLNLKLEEQVKERDARIGELERDMVELRAQVKAIREQVEQSKAGTALIKRGYSDGECA